MAECHPVAFQWVMEAKARGATVIHVDPRFTRTSAVSDLYLPIRAGADITFVGGLINHVLSSGKYFKEYVLAYTNAATILTEDYADTEDLNGVFSGLNREHRYYDFDTWRYQGEDVVKRPAVSIWTLIRSDTCGRSSGRRDAAKHKAPAGPPLTPSRTPTTRCSIRGACSRC